MKKLCAWCKKSDWGDTEASGLYIGTVYNDSSDRVIPFKAWLCEMHQAETETVKCIKDNDNVDFTAN